MLPFVLILLSVAFGVIVAFDTASPLRGVTRTDIAVGVAGFALCFAALVGVVLIVRLASAPLPSPVVTTPFAFALALLVAGLLLALGIRRRRAIWMAVLAGGALHGLAIFGNLV
ncbi:Uncharacterised protein [Starkeya nomas]|uniref:Uncharacterized protein n=1 Tax=Starkeya nomas TaxID=2666134 RepID=A0A5S9R734_9HYPH|nr:hypothetical protein [Starkeya nomas]CAA0130521.1 Uncharacterised protein [Starkeya nomas]